MLKKLVLFSLFLGTTLTYAQDKKALSHEDYDLWKRVNSPEISKNGDLVIAEVATATGRGDGYLEIFNTRTGKTFKYPNAHRATISSDGNYVYFLKEPKYELTRQEKKDDVKAEKRTKEDFFIFDVRQGRILDSIHRVKKYEAPKEATGWLVIEKHKDLKPKKDSTALATTEKDSIKTDKKDNLAYEADYALVYHINNKKADTIFRIKDYQLPETGNRFIFSTTKGEKKGDMGVYYYDLQKQKKQQLDTSRYAYTQLSIDRSAEQLAYLAAKDSTEKDSLKFELFYVKNDKVQQFTDTLGRNLRNNWQLSAAQRPQFSETGKRLFFYSRPVRNFDLDTTLLEEEIPQVDVWSYHDDLLQPEQKSRLKELEDKAYASFIETKSGELVQLHDQSIDYVLFDEAREQRFILGYSSSPYNVERSWEYPWLKDYYIIDTQNGTKRKALTGQATDPTLSPDGNYALYYDQETRGWWSLDLRTGSKEHLTKDLSVNFFDEENDVPAQPWPYGFGGFTQDGDALLYDQFDIWKAALNGKKQPQNITMQGRRDSITYRSLRLDRDHRNLASYYNNGLLLTAFDKNDKSSSLYSLHPKNGKMRGVILTDNFKLSTFSKAEEADALVFKKENFRTAPDLFFMQDPKAEPVKLTNANPQQSNFKWGTVEKFSWKAYDGTPLDGLLYKPENFDPKKQYPLMVYFYEKRSDQLHSYHTPQPSASIVNMSYLVSNDYVVFVPDIVYKEGEPGESAYNAIVSGVDAVEELGFIDSENMAIQGQSWGGYQVAYLITRTNKFKAAMAGAPVSNMTSAYGGIRWQTGLSRAFQYEKTQSRIGKNLWEGFDLYIKNSPLFGIPNIDTPLLMMHNDADGAVPYYQGIEMFMGMRRLNKPVWLLVYNDEAHNLRKVRNKQDLSIRMMQFFDHYLKGAPAPEWMTKGVPAVMKGKDLRYDLDTSEETKEAP